MKKPLTCVAFDDVLALETRPPDDVIAWGDDRVQFGELWLPAGTASRLVIFIHGGCWLNDYHVTHTRPLGAAFADAGMAVWSLEYRRLGDPGAGWPGTFDDIRTGVDFAAGLDLNVERTTVMGHSAGGHLALWTAARTDAAVDDVIALAAIVDLETWAQGSSPCERAGARLIGGAPPAYPERYAAASPARLSLSTPTRCFHAAEEKVVPRSQFDALPAELQTGVIEGAGHFDFIHPGTPAFQQVLAAVTP